MTKKREMTVELYTPHAGQMPIHASRTRFRVANCGRRFGKTLMGDNELLKGALEDPGSIGWWVAPTYKQMYLAFEAIALASRPVLAKDPHWTDFKLSYINGSVIEGRSAKNYNNLRGPGLDRAVIDECRDVDRRAWEESLRPMFSDTGGSAIFISTPRGHDWFWELSLTAQDPLQTEYEYFHFPTSANPYIPAWEIEEARTKLPQRTFEQEYLAIFLEDGGGVFRNVDGCIEGILEPPKLGHFYIIGWDVAKYDDFSVFVVLDVSVTPAHVVGFVRFNGILYKQQVRRLSALGHLYNRAVVVMDATGVGDSVYEEAKAVSRLTVVPYVFHGVSKIDAVDGLVVALEYRKCTYPNIPELISELKAYQYTITAARNVQYSAPASLHDDCVTALALAVYGADLGSSIGFAVAKHKEPEDIPPELDTTDMPDEQAAEINRRQKVVRNVLTQVQRGEWGTPMSIRMER